MSLFPLRRVSRSLFSQIAKEGGQTHTHTPTHAISGAVVMHGEATERRVLHAACLHTQMNEN